MCMTIPGGVFLSFPVFPFLEDMRNSSLHVHILTILFTGPVPRIISLSLTEMPSIAVFSQMSDIDKN